jgi:hypothetical protein
VPAAWPGRSPLLAHLDRELPVGTIQRYRIVDAAVEWIDGAIDDAPRIDECPLPRPLRACSLGAQRFDAITEGVDGLLGGDSFLRIFSPRLVLRDAREPPCLCSSQPTFFAQVGYESWKGRSLMPDTAFFPGEQTECFFYRAVCGIVSVVTEA